MKSTSLKKSKENQISEIEKKHWYFFSWEAGVIIFVTAIAALLNMIPNWIGDSNEIVFQDGQGGKDVYIANFLRDNIVYYSFSIGITILVAIFVGVYTEIGKYAGKYSSALFVLVPSLVWLFSDRSNNHIESIVETSNSMANIIFWSIVSIMALFIVSHLIKNILLKYYRADETKRKIELSFNVVNRLSIVIINILILIMLSYSLLNFGIFTLHFADISPELQQQIEEQTGRNPGQFNLHSEKLTAFIAIIAIVFALLMVAIGMTNDVSISGNQNEDEETDVEADVHQVEEEYKLNEEQGESYG